MILKDKIDFSIVIDFDKNSSNPSRVFKTMSSLIESFEQLDKDLVKHIDNKIETVLMLEDVEKGSLKTILINSLKGIPDDDIENLDYKKIIGRYLVKAKYIILNKLEGKVTLTDATEIDSIEKELLEEAKNVGLTKIPTFAPTSKKILIKNIDNINKSVDGLSENDKVRYESNEGTTPFNLNLKIDVEAMEEMITEEQYVSETKMALKVKKPDYLGDSQWVFKHGNGTISAKISDTEWLGKFQNRKIDVRPQDSLVCIVKVTVKYDYQYEPISTSFEIIKVEKINRRNDDLGQYSISID